MAETAVWTWQYDARIASSPGAGQPALTELLSALHECGWRKEDIFGIHLAVEEALVNAMRHGNKSDLSKQVHVSCKVATDRVLVEILDEGLGFNPDRVPDCTASENLHRPGGRGIMLMRNYMTRVEFLNGGQHVVMEKRKT